MYRSRIVGYLPWIILLSIIWTLSGIYFGFTNLYTLLIVLIFYGLALSFVLYIYLKVEKVFIHLNRLGIENAPGVYKIQNGHKYTGIVIYHKNYKDKKALFSYISAPMLFIEYLKKESRPFKLVVDPDYKEFEELISDPYCNELYIMGHGRLYRLKTGPNKEDTIWYRDFLGYPDKDKVVQLHCNHRDWFIKNRDLKSLTEILHARTDFKQKGMTDNITIMNYFLDKIQDEK